MSNVSAKCPCCGEEMVLVSVGDKFICGSCQTEVLSEAAICYYNYKHNKTATEMPVAQVNGTTDNTADFEVVDGKLVKYKGSSAEVVIPDGICTIIGADAFLFNSITSVFIPDCVKTIEEGAFVGCRDMKSVRLPEQLSTISERTFSYCSSLAQIELPNTLNEIKGYAFYNSGLQTVVIPQSVETIGRWAFARSESLESVKILNPDVVMDADAFKGCYEIASVDYQGTNEDVFYYSQWAREKRKGSK